MPKRSLVLNGFAGGLNKDSNLTDLSSEGRGKDELYESINLLNDYTGKAVATCPINDAGGIDADSGIDSTKDELLIYNDEYYQETGLYKHGDDVEYSGKTTLTDPTALALAAAPGESSRNGLSVAFDTSDNVNVFLGTGATYHTGEAAEAIFGDKTTGWASNGESNNGLNEDIQWQRRTGDETTGSWASQYQITGSAVPWKIDVMDSNDDTLDGTGVGEWRDLDLALFKTIDASYFDFILETASGELDPIIGFRTGAQQFNNESPPYWQSSLFGSGVSVVNKNINIEFSVASTLISNWSNLQSLHIILDSDDDDSTVGYDSKDNAYTREYKFTADELTELGVTAGETKYRFVIDEDSFYQQGGDFVASSVKAIYIVLEFGGFDSLTTGSIFKLYELSFTPSDGEQSTWADNNYIFWQTSLTSTDDDKLESLPVKYTVSTPYSTTDLGSNGLIFTVTKSSSPIHGNIYWQFADGTANGIGNKFLLCAVDSANGVTPVEGNIASWSADDDVVFTFSDRPESSTFEIESGYPDDTTHINALWETAAVVGRQVYIGNTASKKLSIIDGSSNTVTFTSNTIVRTNGSWLTDNFEDDDSIEVVGSTSNDGTYTINSVTANTITVDEDTIANETFNSETLFVASFNSSKILKSAIGKRYGFPDSQYIDLEFGGDNIKVLQSVGDRLFVFSEDKLTIVNVAQDVEILEAQFENMGVTYHKQVCKVGEGIAWVNTHGVHFFDGQQVKSLSDERMLSISWSSDDIIGYFPTRKMLLVWNNSTTVYAFSFKSMSWAGEIGGDLITNIPETNVVSGNDGVTYYVNTNNAIKKIVEDINGTPTITLTTGRIVCGDLSRRKRFKRLYITASNTADTEMAYYKIDGTGDFVSLGALTDGLNTLDINANGRDIQIKISGTANYNTEINDITFIYRDKAVR